LNFRPYKVQRNKVKGTSSKYKVQNSKVQSSKLNILSHRSHSVARPTLTAAAPATFGCFTISRIIDSVFETRACTQPSGKVTLIPSVRFVNELLPLDDQAEILEDRIETVWLELKRCA